MPRGTASARPDVKVTACASFDEGHGPWLLIHRTRSVWGYPGCAMHRALRRVVESVSGVIAPTTKPHRVEGLFCSRPFHWFEVSRGKEEGEVFVCCPSWLRPTDRQPQSPIGGRGVERQGRAGHPTVDPRRLLRVLQRIALSPPAEPHRPGAEDAGRHGPRTQASHPGATHGRALGAARGELLVRPLAISPAPPAAPG
jgi:hypothetical protein